jgi:hypothetical protein
MVFELDGVLNNRPQDIGNTINKYSKEMGKR